MNLSPLKSLLQSACFDENTDIATIATVIRARVAVGLPPLAPFELSDEQLDRVIAFMGSEVLESWRPGHASKTSN
jgi:hypothetical protein